MATVSKLSWQLAVSTRNCRLFTLIFSNFSNKGLSPEGVASAIQLCHDVPMPHMSCARVFTTSFTILPYAQQMRMLSGKEQIGRTPASFEQAGITLAPQLLSFRILQQQSCIVECVNSSMYCQICIVMPK